MSGTTRKHRRGGTVSIVAIVVILALAWSAGWYVLAGYAESATAETLDTLAAKGVRVDCPDRSVGGFPFALRVACGGATTVSEDATRTNARVERVSAGVSVFAPMTVEIIPIAPAAIESPRLTAPAAFNFDSATIDVGMSGNGPRDYAFDASGLRMTLANIPEPLVVARALTGTLTPSGNAGSNVTFRFSDLVLSLKGAALPPFNGSLAVELMVPPRALLLGERPESAPLAARGIDVRLDSGGARIDLQGDLAIDAEGVIDGALVFRVVGAGALPGFIAGLPERWRNLGNALAGGVIAFGQPTRIDGEAASELKLTIEHGRTTIGLISLDLPRIRL